jgi:YVTN family beta-propeller protein
VPGVLAIAAAGLLAAAVALRGPHDVSLPDYVAWYVIAMAALALASGTGMLLPRTRTLIGPGGLIGVAAASVWGLVLSSAPLFAGHTAPFISPRTDPALWCVVGGHVALAAAGCLAGLAVRRDRKVQVVLRRPGNLLTWVLTAVAAAGAILAALALAGELYQAARLDVYARLAGSADPAGPDLAAVVLAVAVPACAAVMRPAGFARWLLAGWVAGAGSVCLGIYAWARGGAEPGPEYAVVLGGALVLLAVAAAAMSRWGVTAPPSARPHRRSALAAGLSAVPLLAASGAVAAYLLAQGPVIQTQSLGAVVSPDGRHLYVTAALHTLSPDPEDPKGEPGRLLVVDTATGRTVGAPVAVGSEPVYLAYSRDGNHVYVANAGENSVSVVSTLENTTEGSPIPIGHPPGQLTASADGSRLLVVDSDHGLSVIDTRANVVSRRIALPGDAGAVVVSADGRRAYFSRGGKGDLSAIDTATGATTAGPVRLGYNPDSMAVSPDGSRLYVLRSGAGTAAGADALSAVDTATLKATGPSAPVEGDLHLGMTVSPDGRRVYVTNLYAGSVSVIDTQLHTSVGTPAPVGDGPREVTVSADGRHVYVTLLGANKVATFSSAAPGTVSLISLTRAEPPEPNPPGRRKRPGGVSRTRSDERF